MKEAIRRGVQNTVTKSVVCPITGLKPGTGLRAGAGLGAVVAAKKIHKAYIVGALVGGGVAALGYYLYLKNQKKVDGFLCDQKIEVKPISIQDYENMEIESLKEVKKKVDEIIEIRKMNAK